MADRGGIPQSKNAVVVHDWWSLRERGLEKKKNVGKQTELPQNDFFRVRGIPDFRNEICHLQKGRAAASGFVANVWYLRKRPVSAATGGFFLRQRI